MKSLKVVKITNFFNKSIIILYDNNSKHKYKTILQNLITIS